MLREFLLEILFTLLIISTNGSPINNLASSIMLGACKNSSACLETTTNYTTMNYNSPELGSSSSSPIELRDKRSNPTSLQVRSYYSGGFGAASPAFYPAFDPISVLASLAFLAFLLQSFTSLFDRSRSIIPAIVSSRDSLQNPQASDVERLIMRALDEYEIHHNDIVLENEEKHEKST